MNYDLSDPNNFANNAKKLAERVNRSDPTRSDKPSKPSLATSPSEDLFVRATYDGRELRPFEGRAGAMDAYMLPSKGI